MKRNEDDEDLLSIHVEEGSLILIPD